MRSRFYMQQVDEKLAEILSDKIGEDSLDIIGLWCVQDDMSDHMRLFDTQDGAYNWRNLLDDTTHVYLNCYMVRREYGGAEEGGWWFDAGEPVESVRYANMKEASAAMAEFEKKWNQANIDEDYIDIGSVRSNGEYQVRMEYKFAEAYPTEKPHYE